MGFGFRVKIGRSRVYHPSESFLHPKQFFSQGQLEKVYACKGHNETSPDKCCLGFQHSLSDLQGLGFKTRICTSIRGTWAAGAFVISAVFGFQPLGKEFGC